MRKTTNRSAFTLVELIVVITILAILGTIGFMSIKGYTGEANNAKVTSDLTTIQRGLETKVAEGGSLMAFVGGADENKMDNIALAGAVAAAPTANYDAGTPNYTALGIKKDEFVDPNGSEYRVAATTTGGGRLELAGVVNIEGTKQAAVKGSYTARDATSQVIDSISGKVVVLNGAATNLFRKDDIVTINAIDYTVDSAKRDGVTLVLSAAPDNSETAIELAEAEIAGLIEDRNTADQVVVNGSGSTLPY